MIQLLLLIVTEHLHDSRSENSQLKETQIQPVSILHLQLKNSFNIIINLGYNLYDPKYVAWLKVNYPATSYL